MADSVVRFGEFDFDLDRKELRRRGSLLRLQAQPALVLGALLQRSGEVVSREELQAAIWGEDTFVDFERGLNFCITQIRATLGDDAARPLYLRTIPRKGYQFIAPVQRQPVVDPSRAPELEEKSQPRIPLWSLAALLILLSAALATIRIRATHASRQAMPVLAVVRFDDENHDPALRYFADALTNDVVVQLTSDSRGKYQVVGSAPILQLPREQRDLRTVGSIVGASYAVIGQVQSGGSKVLILAHLIRLPDLTHVWVVRIEGDRSEGLALQSRAAAEIASQFTDRMSKDPQSAASFPSANR